jgi:formylglycine-generating enzyme required for sulfatase activity
MSDIFISYASEDRDRVKSLAHALERRGWSVWWDRRIPVGRSYDEVIEEALDASKAVVVVWTKTSVKSQWVKNEAREGLSRRVLFPVMILEQVKIPLEFRDVQAAHLMDWQPEQDHAGFDQFLDDLGRVIGVPMTAVVQPSPVHQGLQLPHVPTSPASESPSLSQTTVQVEPVRAALVGNNNLSALSVIPGALAPAFNANTTSYSVDVGSGVTSVSVTPTLQDTTATITVNRQATTSGQARTITLRAAGLSTLIPIVVTAPNASSKTYTITVDRAAPASNNNLSALSVTPGSLAPAYAQNTLTYTVNVASDVTSVTISATKADSNAVMSGDVTAGTGVATGQATIQLGVPGTTTGVTIWVTSPGGSQKTYTLNVSRAALGGNNHLQSLSVSPGTLSPSFSGSRTAYTANVGDNVTSVTVTPWLQDDNSSVTINGQGTSSGQARFITLAPAGSSTEIEIIVTAPNGSSKTYLITVSRATLLRPAEVELEPERQEPEPSATSAGAVNSGSQREAFRHEEASGFGRESGHAGEDRSSESAGKTGRSTDSFPFLPIGLGALVAIGALVYFVGGPFFVKRDEPLPRPTAELPSVKTDVTTPTAAPEPVKQSSAGATQQKSIVKEGVGPSKEAASEVSKRNQGQPKTHTPSPEPSKKPLVRTTEGTSPTNEERIHVNTLGTDPRAMASPAKTITGKDGAPMVLIPAGEFMMGSREDDKSAGSDERPAHRVYLDAYYIDQYEVTTARYATFFQETERRESAYWSEQVVKQHGNKPVVGVNWDNAGAYCERIGKRLPTEAEWEKAARGTDQRAYPWGNQAPTDQRANFNRIWDKDPYERLTDVGSFEGGKSPYGAYDMAGNVWEWVADWYDEDYYSKSPERNPTGPSSGQFRVIRGGSWFYAPHLVRSALRLRNTPTTRSVLIGFRCAQDIPK